MTMSSSRKIRRWVALLCILGGAEGANAQAPLAFGAPFSDRAVLQRDRAISIWGTAASDRSIAVTFDGTTVHTRTDARGVWRTILPAHGPGGPYRLNVRDDRGTIRTLRDVQVGDVWLCSGQSNMEYTVDRALNAKLEIEGSVDDRLRFLPIARASAAGPASEYRGAARWVSAGPATTGGMSAVCYFMGQSLRKASRIPIGLIAASWGGTGIDSWRSEAALRADGRETERLDLLDRYRAAPARGLASWSARWEAWWRDRVGDTPWEATYRPGPDWRPVPAFVRWEDWGDPALAHFDGLMWYRTEIVLTADQARTATAVSIGVADDIDNSWVNGRLVGTSGHGADGVRRYDLPRGLMHAGRNVVAISVRDLWNWGGLTGPRRDRAILLAHGRRVPLDGPWYYRPARATLDHIPMNPWQSVGGIASLYNGMIAPLGAYGLAGIAWYQGEANATLVDAPRYKAQLTSLMADWRAHFGRPDLPFVIVQLPEYRAATSVPQPSGWALLREAQRRAVATDGHAALVVTLGLGSATDVHPADKKSVGLRAARAATWLTTRGAPPPSGPVGGGARHRDGVVLVAFRDVDRGLVTFGSNSVIGFQLCGVSDASCRYADATVSGATAVAVAIPPMAERPTRLRFCWADNPQCNLTDASGMPGGPFELELD